MKRQRAFRIPRLALSANQRRKTTIGIHTIAIQTPPFPLFPCLCTISFLLPLATGQSGVRYASFSRCVPLLRWCYDSLSYDLLLSSATHRSLLSAHLAMRRKYLFVGQVLLLLLVAASLYFGSHRIARLPTPLRFPGSGQRKEDKDPASTNSGKFLLFCVRSISTPGARY